MARTLEESFDKNGAIAEGRLRLGHGALERILEIGLLANNTHTTTSTTHSCFDDH